MLQTHGSPSGRKSISTQDGLVESVDYVPHPWVRGRVVSDGCREAGPHLTRGEGFSISARDGVVGGRPVTHTGNSSGVGYFAVH